MTLNIWLLLRVYVTLCTFAHLRKYGQLLQWHHELPRAPISKKAGSNAYPWPGRS